jgi:5-formyltetrahydrofolate cyclo-ligase
MLAKKEKRAFYRQLQTGFPEEHFRVWNAQLAAPLQQLLQNLPAGDIAVYRARPREADLSSLFTFPRQFCFPRVLSKNGEMEFRYADPLNPMHFAVGSFGILEPQKGLPLADKNKIVACFVPLLAFDGQGRRLGQGKGFYDRFLQGFPGERVGVAFEWQFSPHDLPAEETDQVLDYVITEHGVRKF